MQEIKEGNQLMLDNRFWDKVCASKVNFYNGTACQEWTANKNNLGYGQFWLNDKMKLTHRLSYEDKFGKIPDGLEINHMCHNRCCCNPDHLEAITHKENVQKGLSPLLQRLKTHCPQGHEYSEENTYINPSGARVCRICHRIREHQYRHRKKQDVSGSF